jgi:hypothetical protein
VRTGPCLGVWTVGGVFFAGFAAIGEIASTHTEHKTATKESVSAKRGFRSMAVRVRPIVEDDAVSEAQEQVSARLVFGCCLHYGCHVAFC